jgi:hypothetical protein
MCRRKVTQDAAIATDAFPLGEHAHIVGERPGSARHDASLTDEERDGYTNRLLLCPSDHTLVDKDEGGWPVAKLHMVKADHELWVEQTLTTEQTVRDQANELIYSTLIDAATDDLVLSAFTRWASLVLERQWRFRGHIWDGIERFRYAVFVADWPGTLPDLEVAVDRASFELQEAVVLFTQHSELDGDGDFIARRWYKATLHSRDVYVKLDSDFWLWSDTLEARIIEATKALNWMREVWRAEVNPMWLATEGWFALQRDSYIKPRYTDQEKAELRAAGVGQHDIRRPKVHRR